MNLKRSFNKRLAISAFALAGSVAQAQGIPVIDGAHVGITIANEVEQIAKWVAQFEQLQQQINQYKQQFEAITGSRGMAALLDNPLIHNSLPPDWQNVITQVKSTAAYLKKRQQYPTLTGSPAANSMYDTIASQEAVMEDMYSKTSQRIQQIQSLMAKIDSANDPAAKMDLTNRLISEQNAVQANQNLVTILQSKQKQELDAASKAASNEFACKEFRNC